MRRMLAIIVLAALGAPVLPGRADPPGLRAVTVNTPGQSGHVPLPDLVLRTAGQEVAYGQHMTDQLSLYSRLEYRPGNLHQEGGVPDAVAGGARIYRDAFGVPAVFAETLESAWYGVGYALAQDRMWQMHLLRMVAKGRLSELVGRAGLGMDLQIRRDFYTPAEYALWIDRIEPWQLQILLAYSAGVNQYIAEMHADPRKMPAEIAALGLPIEPWTPIDTAALGALVARSVASDGGQELENAELLRDLVDAHGVTDGKEIFNDLLWRNDPGAPTSVPASGCGFASCDFPSYPGVTPDIPGSLENSRLFVQSLPHSASTVAGILAAERALRDRLREALGLPNPGSDVWAVSPARSDNDHTFLFNGPQVGYTMPGLLAEFEIHGGAGDMRMDARGITVAGVPVVGIGYTPDHAWGLTSGLSDTIDLYVEQLDENDTHTYFVNDEPLKMDCRTETFLVKSTLEIAGFLGITDDDPGLPTVETREMCRTVHGPVIAIDAANQVAYAQRYAIWDQELGTLDALLRFPMTHSLAEFHDAVALATWNENTTYADAAGNIAYYHPGRYPLRPLDYDERLPYPGTGEAEWVRLLTFDEMPKAKNPDQGWVANWNSKPSAGWTSADPHYSDRPWGEANRLDMIGKVLDASTPIGAIPSGDVNGIVDGTSGIFAPDVSAGLHDGTVDYFRPLLAAAKGDPAATPAQKDAIDEVLAWDGRFTDGNGDGKVDSPGQTIFFEWVEPAAKSFFDPYLTIGGFSRGGHRFEPSPVINLFLRALKGGAAPLPQSRDYIGGKTANVAILDTLDDALGRLQSRFGSPNMSGWLNQAPTVGLDVQGLGPDGTIPFHDRGSWIEVVEYFAS